MATLHKIAGQDEQHVKNFRRRQSDARWRANLASCYETLKLVIPLTTRASKKQISKAYILKAASKHISFLENMLVMALHDQGQMEGQANLESWCADRIRSVIGSFEFEQEQRLVKQRTLRGGYRRRQSSHARRHAAAARCRRHRTDTTSPATRMLLPTTLPAPPPYINLDDAAIDNPLLFAGCTDYPGPMSPLNSEDFNYLTCTPVKDNQIFSELTNGMFTPVKLPVNYYSFMPTEVSFTSQADELFEKSTVLSDIEHCGHIRELTQCTDDAADDDGTISCSAESLMCDELMWLSDDEDTSTWHRNESTPKRSVRKRQHTRCTTKCKLMRQPDHLGTASSGLDDDGSLSDSCNEFERVSSGEAVEKCKRPLRCRRALDCAYSVFAAGDSAGRQPLHDMHSAETLVSGSFLSQPTALQAEKFNADVAWLHAEFFPALLTHELDTSATGDPLSTDPMSDCVTDSSLMSPISAAVTQLLADSDETKSDRDDSDSDVMQCFISAAAANTPLLGALRPSTSELQLKPTESLPTLDDCHNQPAVDFTALLSPTKAVNGDQSFYSEDSPEFLGQYSPLFGRQLLTM